MEFLYDAALNAFVMWLPLVAADNGGGLARMLRLPYGSTSVDDVVFEGDEVLGPNKTTAALYLGPALCYAAIQIEVWISSTPSDQWYVFLAAVGGGCGAVLGDYLKSGIKRAKNMPPGQPWFPWDQIDYVVGGYVGYALVSLGQGLLLHPVILALMVLFALLTKTPGNWIFYCIGLRNTPY
ncbi:MAG: CDP-archaeol synthase [Patescibacteria group bacterium]|nr:CDP-archaeol synthase [Patescibacteria group bacterium]